jgi:hypothetical protein
MATYEVLIDSDFQIGMQNIKFLSIGAFVSDVQTGFFTLNARLGNWMRIRRKQTTGKPGCGLSQPELSGVLRGQKSS